MLVLLYEVQAETRLTVYRWLDIAVRVISALRSVAARITLRVLPNGKGPLGEPSLCRATGMTRRAIVYRWVKLVQLNPTPRAPRLFGTLTSLNIFLVDKTLLTWKCTALKVSFMY